MGMGRSAMGQEGYKEGWEDRDQMHWWRGVQLKLVGMVKVRPVMSLPVTWKRFHWPWSSDLMRFPSAPRKPAAGQAAPVEPSKR